MHDLTANASRTTLLIAQARLAGARSYMARFKAMNLAGWAVLLQREAARLRQPSATKAKK